MSIATKSHWENIYHTKQAHEVSWTQETPYTSIQLFEAAKLPKNAQIIDVGGGDSRFVDYLIDHGFTHVSVLDISEKALERAKERLGAKASLVNWIVSDIKDFIPTLTYDFWHDRAAFHFLTEQKDIEQYVRVCKQSAKKIAIGTFSTEGPLKCSGLDIAQYDEKSLSKLFETVGFTNAQCQRVDHKTPSGANQNFVFCSYDNV
jgi:ubiquinone/menaquinone biosynthesis C-methylase UbiE